MHSQKLVKNSVSLRERLLRALIKDLSDKKCSLLTKVEKREIKDKITSFKAFASPIKKGAMNTTGGVSTLEIKPSTMESKIKIIFILLETLLTLVLTLVVTL